MSVANTEPITVSHHNREPLKLVSRSVDTSIWVTFAKHGIHRYPDAPNEVGYLSVSHRHLFKFKVGITVHHDDREIEFHMFQNWLMSLYEGEQQLTLDNRSCEMIAAELIAKIQGKYDCDHRTITVEVSEDGECGAVLVDRPVWR